jgi:hypothetical protein
LKAGLLFAECAASRPPESIISIILREEGFFLGESYWSADHMKGGRVSFWTEVLVIAYMGMRNI